MSNNIWQWGILGIQDEQGYRLANLATCTMYALVDKEFRIIAFFQYSNTRNFIHLYLDSQSKSDIMAGNKPQTTGLVYTYPMFRDVIVHKLNERRIADVICKAINSTDLLVVEDLRFKEAKNCITYFAMTHANETVLQCTFQAPESQKDAMYFFVVNYGNYRDEDRITEYTYCANGVETTVEFSENTVVVKKFIDEFDKYKYPNPALVTAVSKCAKRMYDQYGEIQLEFAGYLVAKVRKSPDIPVYVTDAGDVKEIYELPDLLKRVEVPQNYNEISPNETHPLSRRMIRLIKAISVEVGHMPHYRQYGEYCWKVFW